MPVCPTCGRPFSYTESHICEGRDKTKIWLLTLVAVGAVVGALIGGPLGLLYANSVVRQACERPDATNLCGLTSAPFVPFYVMIGAVIGAASAALAVMVVLDRRRSPS